MKKITFLFILILSFCLNPFSFASEDVQMLNDIVAVVNDKVITRIQLDQSIHFIKAQMNSMHKQLPPDDILEKQLLQQMIEQQLQLQQATEMGIKISSDAVRSALLTVAKQNHMSKTDFIANLKAENISFANYNKRLKDQLTLQAVQGQAVASRVKVSANEIDNFLRTMKSEEASAQYQVTDYLVSMPDDPSPQDWDSAKKEAKSYFNKLNTQKDVQNTKVTKSDLGWRKFGEFPTLFQKTLKKLKKGQYSHPIQTPNGYHILFLQKVKGGETSHFVTQVKIKQILLQSHADDASEIKSKLNNYREQIQDGVKFSTIAKNFSENADTASKGGDLGWLNMNELPPQMAQIAQKIKLNTTSRPFNIENSWFLIEISGRRQINGKKLYRKLQAQQMLFQRKLNEDLQTWISELKANSYIKVLKA